MKNIKNNLMLASMFMFAQASLFGAVATTGGQSAVTRAASQAAQSVYAAGARILGATPSVSSISTSTLAKISPDAYQVVSSELTSPSVSSSSSITPYALPTLAATGVVAGVLASPAARAYAQSAWKGASSAVSGMFRSTKPLRMSYQQAAQEFGLPTDKETSKSEIKKVYKELSKKYHPDVAGSASIAKFQEIQEAYETLMKSSLETSESKNPWDMPKGYQSNANVLSYAQAAELFGFSPNQPLSVQAINERYEELQRSRNAGLDTSQARLDRHYSYATLLRPNMAREIRNAGNPNYQDASLEQIKFEDKYFGDLGDRMFVHHFSLKLIPLTVIKNLKFEDLINKLVGSEKLLNEKFRYTVGGFNQLPDWLQGIYFSALDGSRFGVTFDKSEIRHLIQSSGEIISSYQINRMYQEIKQYRGQEATDETVTATSIILSKVASLLEKESLHTLEGLKSKDKSNINDIDIWWEKLIQNDPVMFDVVAKVVTNTFKIRGHFNGKIIDIRKCSEKDITERYEQLRKFYEKEIKKSSGVFTDEDLYRLKNEYAAAKKCRYEYQKQNNSKMKSKFYKAAGIVTALKAGAVAVGAYYSQQKSDDKVTPNGAKTGQILPNDVANNQLPQTPLEKLPKKEEPTNIAKSSDLLSKDTVIKAGLLTGVGSIVASDPTTWKARYNNLKLTDLLQNKNSKSLEEFLEGYVKGGARLHKGYLDRGAYIDGKLLVAVLQEAIEQKNNALQNLALLSIARAMKNDEFKLFIKEKNIDINKVDQEGQTILSRAIELNNLDIVQKILAAGAKVSQMQQEKIDALQNAARKKWYQW